MASTAYVPLVLLSILAPIAAVDVLYFHMYRFRLHARPGSRVETVTHVVRGLLIGTVALLLARWEPRGAWFWVVAAAIAADFANNIADVIVEPASRASLGGLPPAEYLIHIVGASGSGAIGAIYVYAAWPQAAMATALAPATGLPAWLAVNATLIAAGSFVFATIEGALLLRGGCCVRAPQVAASVA